MLFFCCCWSPTLGVSRLRLSDAAKKTVTVPVAFCAAVVLPWKSATCTEPQNNMPPTRQLQDRACSREKRSITVHNVKW